MADLSEYLADWLPHATPASTVRIRSAEQFREVDDVVHPVRHVAAGYAQVGQEELLAFLGAAGAQEVFRASGRDVGTLHVYRVPRRDGQTAPGDAVAGRSGDRRETAECRLG